MSVRVSVCCVCECVCVCLPDVDKIPIKAGDLIKSSGCFEYSNT